jgi:putative transposase
VPIVARENKSPPSYGIVDAPSVKTVLASARIGIDGGKNTQGRKRHLVVDVLGHRRHVQVHAANAHDTKAAPAVLARAVEQWPTWPACAADAG